MADPASARVAHPTSDQVADPTSGGQPAVVEAARSVVGTAGGPTLAVWASCAGGCEPEAAAELAALGWTDTTRERGSVHGLADLAGVYRALWTARTVTRVTWRLHAGEADGLDDVAAAVRALDLTVLPDAPFAVVAERDGEHPFRSPDVARVAGQAVIDAYRVATGRRLPVDLDEPATVLRVELTGSRLQVGLELTGASLHHRGHLVVPHHAGLKPTIAACLLVTAGWRAHERLLDPMCGAGTIPLEAALAALRRPPRRAAPPRLAALGLHDQRLARSVAADVRAAAQPLRPLRIEGRDRDRRDVRAARANAAAAGLADVVALRRGDATALDASAEVDCVVTNPPYGKRMGRRAAIHGLYEDVLGRLADVLSPAGRVVFLTSAPNVATRAAERAGLRLDGRPAIGLGSFDAYACRFIRPGTGEPVPAG